MSLVIQPPRSNSLLLDPRLRMAQRFKARIISELDEQTQEGRDILREIAKSRAFIYPIRVRS